MASTRQTLPQTWNASARILASGDTDVLAENTSDRDGTRVAASFYWWITTTTTAPTIDPTMAHEIAPGEKLSMILPDTRYLWLVSRIPMDISLTTEA